MTNDAWRALEGHRSRVEQVRENSARLAWATGQYTTEGIGSIAESSCFEFEMAFLDLPTFSAGPTMGEDVDLPDSPADWPTLQAFVYKWRRDGNGFYTGAWVAFTVTARGFLDPSQCTVVWTMAWFGIASKSFTTSPKFPISALEL